MPFTEIFTPLLLFFDPPFCPLLSSACTNFLFTCIFLSTSSFCCQRTPWGGNQQLYWAFASGVHKSLGFEGFAGCCSDWDEYCISVQCTVSNSTSIFSVHWAEFLTSHIILSLLQWFHKVNPCLLTHRESSGEIYTCDSRVFSFLILRFSKRIRHSLYSTAASWTASNPPELTLLHVK